MRSLIQDYKTFEKKNIKDVFIIKYVIIILFICIERARMKEREKKIFFYSLDLGIISFKVIFCVLYLA